MSATPSEQRIHVLLYHLAVLLQNEGLGLKDVVQRLYERHTK